MYNASVQTLITNYTNQLGTLYSYGWSDCKHLCMMQQKKETMVFMFSVLIWSITMAFLEQL